MVRIFLTYFFAVAFFCNLMVPTASCLYALFSGNTEQHISFDFLDSEKEEKEGQGENETKDHKENEKSEDEKLKHQKDKFFILYVNNTLRSRHSEFNTMYRGIAQAVPTPPPKFS